LVLAAAISTIGVTTIVAAPSTRNPDPAHIVLNHNGDIHVFPVGTPDRVVTQPHADAPTTRDVRNVQWAVDHTLDGTVVLREGTFEFGDGSSAGDYVGVFNPVVIKGMKRGGNLLTTVHGGYLTFRTYEQVPVTIRDLIIDGALTSAIVIATADSATIKGNEITNTLPGPWFTSGLWSWPVVVTEFGWALEFSSQPVPQFPGQAVPDPESDPDAVPNIWVDTGANDYFTSWLEEKPELDRRVTGKLVVQGNTIDTFTDPDLDPAAPQPFRTHNGIVVFNVASELDVRITHNTVRNVPHGPIYVSGVRYGKVAITDNVVEQRTYGFVHEGNAPLWLHGILAVPQAYGLPAPARIERNTLTGIGGTGIWTMCLHDSRIVGNQVVMAKNDTAAPTFAALAETHRGIFLAHSNFPYWLFTADCTGTEGNNVVRKNRISGNTDIGIFLYGSANNNRLRANDTAGLAQPDGDAPLEGDIVLDTDTYDNLVVVKEGTVVVDLSDGQNGIVDR